MGKRSFLQAVLAAATGGAVPLPAAAAPAAVRLVIVQASPVAGFQYHAGEHVWPLLRVGDRLDLVREADNTHDEPAVRVDWNGEPLGYVPRLENVAVAQMLDRGEALHARVTALAESRNPWERVELEVVLDYVVRAYRDSRLGHWLFGRGSGVLQSAGIGRLVTRPGDESHRHYLEGVGFRPEGDRYVLELRSRRRT